MKTNPNNPVVILRSRWSLHPAIVPIEGAVLFELDENGKLRIYLKLKCNFGFENYLHILSDFNQRKSSPNLESVTIN